MMDTNSVVQIFYRRAEMYDLDYVDYTADIQFNIQLACELARDGKVLEFACGTGRITFPLARAGTDITGVDITPAMLDIAKAKLTREIAEKWVEPGQVRLLEGDMRSFDAGKGQYKYVLIPFTSFLHLTSRPDQQEALANCYDHLIPGGYFLADIFLPDATHLARYLGSNLLSHEKVAVSEERNIMLVRLTSSTYDQATQIISQKWYYQVYELTGERRLLESYWVPIELRVIFPAEWELLLEAAGFRIVEKWGDFARTPFGPKSSRMLFLCQKPK
jgi:SAM-dependent methyltransferase